MRYSLNYLGKYHAGDGTYKPKRNEVTVYDDQWTYVYEKPAAKDRYAFCIMLSVTFDTDPDFVPVWRKDRRFNAEDWPNENYGDDYNAEVIGNPDKNWNAEKES